MTTRERLWADILSRGDRCQFRDLEPRDRFVWDYVQTITVYPDGSRLVEFDGVRMSVGARGAVYSLSDWSRVSELVRREVLVCDAWRGSGIDGHDTYRLKGSYASSGRAH